MVRVELPPDVACNTLVVRNSLSIGSIEGDLNVSGFANTLRTVVFRPGDPQGDHENVFTAWAACYAAFASLRDASLGQVDIEFDDRYVTPAVIPAGTYDMTHARWKNTPKGGNGVTVELADGALFTSDPAYGALIRFCGNFLTVRCNRTLPGPAPFTDINIITEGTVTRFLNTNPLALPMFAAVGANISILFPNGNTRGGLGSVFGSSPAPLVDLAGNVVNLRAGAGTFANNIFTDSVGGGAAIVTLFNGTAVGDPISEFDNPNIGGGVVIYSGFAIQNVRSIFEGPIDNTFSPYDCFYNELVLVDSTTGAITVNLPKAAIVAGERVTVKDYGNNAALSNITIASAFGDTIESGLISNNSGSKTWQNDGASRWVLVAVV